MTQGTHSSHLAQSAPGPSMGPGTQQMLIQKNVY